jgi:TPR repeat protein
MDTHETIEPGGKRRAPAGQRASKSSRAASSRRAKAPKPKPSVEPSLIVTTDTLIESLEKLVAEDPSAEAPAAKRAVRNKGAHPSASTVTAEFEPSPSSNTLNHSLNEVPHALHRTDVRVTSALNQKRRSLLSRWATLVVLPLAIVLAALGAGSILDLPKRIMMSVDDEIPVPSMTTMDNDPGQAVAKLKLIGTDRSVENSKAKHELLSAEQPAGMNQGITVKATDTIKAAQAKQATEPANVRDTSREPESEKTREPATADQPALEPIETVEAVILHKEDVEPDKTVKPLGLDANEAIVPQALQEANTEREKTAQGPESKAAEGLGSATRSQPGNETDKTVQPLSARAIAALVDRGDRLLSMADVGAARLVYERAAAAGDAQAALRLGVTYDSSFLSQARLRTVRADPSRASYWYERARDLGAMKSTEPLRTMETR